MDLSPPHNYGIGEWCKFIKEKNEEILQEKEKLSLVLDRYLALINSETVEDFTRIDIWPPVPNLNSWLKTGKLFLAVNMLEAMNGNSQQGVTCIIHHINFLKKIIRSSRDITTNLIAKSIMNDSVIGLANLMNLQNCPKQIYKDILGKLETISYADYGSKNSFIGKYLTSCMEIDRWKRGFKTGSLSEYIMGLFIQKNRTKKLVYDYYSQLLEWEKKPPYQWQDRGKYLVGITNNSFSNGWFWWLHNPGGKKIARSQMTSPFLLLRSNQTRSLYDMLLISAELHLKWTAGRSIEEELAGLNTYQTLLDPCSGKSYHYNKKRKILYSVGMDGVDDGGKDERIFNLGSDFILPVTLDDE